MQLDNLECLATGPGVECDDFIETYFYYPRQSGSDVIICAKDVYVPITSKNAFGSMPWAEVKSVPVFLSDLMAARIPCTAATQDTREKTVELFRLAEPLMRWIRMLTDDFSTEFFGLLAGERGSQTTGDNVDEYRLGCESRNRGGQELSGLDALNEADIGTSICSELETVDGLIHTKHLSRVGTTNDDLQDVT